ncbi:hypothetical protein NQ315_013782 [Exocentrus adspersus]|uniref:Uncharacterized protein n=1 Tax=Exocentrus adspersus TaxID=1586481 RepID=A0AAV8W3R4_9CUCU|nr:hypothetical protein NQ315_013782 [Exocentrus adspersus]
MLKRKQTTRCFVFGTLECQSGLQRLRRICFNGGLLQDRRVLAVGIFAENPVPLTTTYGRSGLIKGGDWSLLGIQCVTVLCLLIWGIFMEYYKKDEKLNMAYHYSMNILRKIFFV